MNKSLGSRRARQRLFILMIMTSLVVGVSQAPMMAEPSRRDVVFSDAVGHPDEAHIQRLAGMGIVGGYGGGIFGPEDPVTREQFAKMLVLAAHLRVDMGANLGFADADMVSEWARPYVSSAVREGLIGGVGNNTFAPRMNVTRAQALTMIARALIGSAALSALEDGKSWTGFEDDDSIADWSRPAINYARKKGIMSLNDGRVLSPDQDSTRAICCRFLSRFVDVHPVSVRTAQAGYDFGMALLYDGSVWTWGDNGDGQLGIGKTGDISVPTKIMDDVISIATSDGSSHAFALKADRTLWAWGDNQSGQLGNGTKAEQPSPVRVMDDVVEIETYTKLYSSSTYAIKSDGSLWGWGANGVGQLGIGTKESKSSPVKIIDGGVETVHANYGVAFAIKGDGSLWGWGYNSHGQIGTGTKENVLVPTKIMDGVRSVSSGGYDTFAVKRDDSLWSWGWGLHGTLANGNDSVFSTLTPKMVMRNVKAVFPASDFTFILKNDGTLWSCGYNYYGQLGNGTTETTATVTRVGEGFETMIVGDNSVYGIKTDGSLWACGDNDDGRLGDGTEITRPNFVKTMDGIREVSTSNLDFAYYVRRDNSLWASGNNGTYYIGDGTIKDHPTPVLVIKGGEADPTETSSTPPALARVLPTGVTLSASSLNLREGDGAQLSATISPADSTNQAMTWSSSNPRVASVSSSGSVTALGAGSAVVIAATANGQTAKCTVTVKYESPLEQGSYAISNSANGLCMNAYSDVAIAFPYGLVLAESDDSPEQKVIPVLQEDGSYRLKVMRGDGMYIYTEGDLAAGSKLYVHPTSCSAFVIRTHSSGDYVIACRDKPELALTSSGEKPYASKEHIYVKLAAYTGAATQLWSFDGANSQVHAPVSVDMTDSGIRARITDTYARAKEIALEAKCEPIVENDSFDGWCGAYVVYQLRALGIHSGFSTLHAKDWYRLFPTGKTSGGYSVLKLPGEEGLRQLVRTYGDEIYNIVVCFPKDGEGSEKDGHALFIHAIKNDTVYWSESRSSRNIPEGAVRTNTLDGFTKQYRSNGTPNGVIYFDKHEELPTKLSFPIDVKDASIGDTTGIVDVSALRAVTYGGKVSYYRNGQEDYTSGHYGTDYRAVDLSFGGCAGKSVYAVAEGTVVRVRDSHGSVYIKHTVPLTLHDSSRTYHTWYSVYVHMAGITVQEGQRITQRTVIGKISDKGADSYHLHFSVTTKLHNGNDGFTYAYSYPGAKDAKTLKAYSNATLSPYWLPGSFRKVPYRASEGDIADAAALRRILGDTAGAPPSN